MDSEPLYSYIVCDMPGGLPPIACCCLRTHLPHHAGLPACLPTLPVASGCDPVDHPTPPTTPPACAIPGRTGCPPRAGLGLAHLPTALGTFLSCHAYIFCFIHHPSLDLMGGKEVCQVDSYSLVWTSCPVLTCPTPLPTPAALDMPTLHTLPLCTPP